MSCRVYTIGIDQDGKRYQADVILSSRVVRGALGQKSVLETVADKAVGLYRRMRGIPTPGYREPHTVKQYLVNQFNDAILRSRAHQEFEQLVAERRAQAAQARNLKSATIPKGFRPIELRQFRQMTVTSGRRATVREHAQYMVLGLMNIPSALTPEEA